MSQPSSRATIQRAVAQAYIDHDGPMDNASLYREVRDRLPQQGDLFETQDPVGRAGVKTCLAKREVRWVQQTLKVRGLLTRVDQATWALTEEGRAKLRKPKRGMMLLGFSTALGLAAWGDCRDVIDGMDSEITLCLTSPCYPIRKGRNYGQIDEHEYVDWLCDIMSGVAKRLRKGGNILMILGQDVFEKGSPSRSLYLERLILAMHDRLGLSLMDRIIWDNPSKPPGPIQWASKKRMQLNVGYEFALWFCNDPVNTVADNRRVLQPHNERHQKFLVAGGVDRLRTSADGCYSQRPGKSFARVTEGRIPKNVLQFGHSCASQRSYKSACNGMGIPAHGAPFPLALARMLVRYLSDQTGLVFDPFGGSITSGLAAEIEGRPWLVSEQFGEYVLGGSTRFQECPDFQVNPELYNQLAA